MSGAQGTGDAAAQPGAGAYRGGAAARDEVGGVHVRAVAGLGDEEGDLDLLGQSLVGGDAELAHRLLVPEVVVLGQDPPQADGVEQVEACGPVVHQWYVGAHVLA